MTGSYKRVGETYVTKGMLAMRDGFLPVGTELVVVGYDRAGWTVVAAIEDCSFGEPLDTFEVSTSMLANEVL